MSALPEQPDKYPLLFHSNAPYVPTGYGQQTGLFAPHLKEHYDLAISAFYGLEGSPINWRGVPVLPGLGGTFGNQELEMHARIHFGGDPRGGLVVTLMDVWVLDSRMIGRLNAACWVPVDHAPCAPAVMRFFAESGATPLAMSRYGMDELAEFDPIYVPHGIDLDKFKPQDRVVSRATLGIPEDAFVVGMVAANKGRPSRKGFQQALEGFRLLRERHSDAHLHLHTVISPEHSQGEDINALLASLQIPEESVTVASQYRAMFMPWRPEEMATIHSAFDVLLNPAYGEGFGVPILEAQACGVPAVVSDFSAMKEVCGEGWKLPVRPLWTGQNSWQGVPDPSDIAQALHECRARSDQEIASQAKRARSHAEQYALPKVLNEHLLPALSEVRERIGEPLDVEQTA